MLPGPDTAMQCITRSHTLFASPRAAFCAANEALADPTRSCASSIPSLSIHIRIECDDRSPLGAVPSPAPDAAVGPMSRLDRDTRDTWTRDSSCNVRRARTECRWPLQRAPIAGLRSRSGTARGSRTSTGLSSTIPPYSKLAVECTWLGLEAALRQASIRSADDARSSYEQLSNRRHSDTSTDCE